MSRVGNCDRPTVGWACLIPNFKVASDVVGRSTIAAGLEVCLILLRGSSDHVERYSPTRAMKTI